MTVEADDKMIYIILYASLSLSLSLEKHHLQLAERKTRRAPVFWPYDKYVRDLYIFV